MPSLAMHVTDALHSSHHLRLFTHSTSLSMSLCLSVSLSLWVCLLLSVLRAAGAACEDAILGWL